MQDYKGKHIWIIGASSGIGRALAQELATRGAILALSARRADKLEEVQNLCEGEGHITVPMDAGDTESTHQAFEQIQRQFPQIDSVVFMAAVYGEHDGEQKEISFIHDMIRVNVGGAYDLLDVIVPYYQEKGQGQIAICASVAGYRGLPTGQPYCSTKAALINLCESLRTELSPLNIDVKVINPGFVQTPLTDKNEFPMPMIISAQEAATYIADDLLKKKFEIHFPKKFTFLMKILRHMPSFLYFWLIKKIRQN